MMMFPVEPGPVSATVRPGVKAASDRTSSSRSVWSVWEATALMLIGEFMTVVLRRVAVTTTSPMLTGFVLLPALAAGAVCASAGDAARPPSMVAQSKSVL